MMQAALVNSYWHFYFSSSFQAIKKGWEKHKYRRLSCEITALVLTQAHKKLQPAHVEGVHEKG